MISYLVLPAYDDGVINDFIIFPIDCFVIRSIPVQFECATALLFIQRRPF